MRKTYKFKPWLESFIFAILITAAIVAIFGFCWFMMSITNIDPMIVLGVIFVITLTISIRIVLF